MTVERGAWELCADKAVYMHLCSGTGVLVRGRQRMQRGCNVCSSRLDTDVLLLVLAGGRC